MYFKILSEFYYLLLNYILNCNFYLYKCKLRFYVKYDFYFWKNEDIKYIIFDSLFL